MARRLRVRIAAETQRAASGSDSGIPTARRQHRCRFTLHQRPREEIVNLPARAVLEDDERTASMRYLLAALALIAASAFFGAGPYWP
jgi:hypothetical protein